MTPKLTEQQKEERQKIRQEEKEKAKQLKLKMKYRHTVCAGCRSNRYNFQSDNGVDAPTTGAGCWYLGYIAKGECPQWSGGR
jgi:hypothetical protein